jgi:hypothetical protein
MPAYQLSVKHYDFTRWYNEYYGTNHSERNGVPTHEWNCALQMLNMTHVAMPGGGTSEASYVLRASDGGEMARQTRLDRFGQVTRT